MTPRSISRRQALAGGGCLALLGLPIKDFRAFQPLAVTPVAGPPRNGPRFPNWGVGEGPYVGQVIANDAGDSARDLDRRTWAESGLNCIGTENRGKLNQGVWSQRGGSAGRGGYDWSARGSRDIPLRLAYQEVSPGAVWSVHAGHWYRSIPADYGWTAANWQQFATDHIREMWNAFRPYADRIVRLDIVNEPIHASGGAERAYMHVQESESARSRRPPGYWEAASLDPSWNEGAENWPRLAFRVARSVGIPKELCFVNQFGCTIAHNAFGAADQGSGAPLAAPPEFVAARANNREHMAHFNHQLFDGYINLAERIIDNGGAGDGHIGGIGFQHHTDPDNAFDRQLFEWQMAECLRLDLSVAVTELNCGMSTQKGFGYPDRGVESSVLSAQYLYHVMKAYLTVSNCREITVWAPTRSKHGTDFFGLYIDNEPTMLVNALARAVWEAAPVGSRRLKPRKTWFLTDRSLPLGVTPTGTVARDGTRGGWQPRDGGLDLGGWPWRRRNGRYEPFPAGKWCFEGTLFKQGGDAGTFLVVADAAGRPICTLTEHGTGLTLTVGSASGERRQTYPAAGSAGAGFFAFVLAYDAGTFRFCMRRNNQSFADPATLAAAVDRVPARIVYGGGDGSGGRNVSVFPVSLYPAEVAPIETGELRALCTVKHSNFLTRSEIEGVDLAGWHDGQPRAT